jgi:ATP-dependent DNA ligase
VATLFIGATYHQSEGNSMLRTQWVRSKLVCEVKYVELTADDQLRQTTFLGQRDDKRVREVVLE